MIANYKNLSRHEYLDRFFNILNCMQLDESKRLSPSEKQFLIDILMLPDKFEYFRFSSVAKKVIINKIEEETGMRHSHQNLNNKIYNLVRKGYLWKDTDGQTYFKPYILKAITSLDKALAEGNHYDFTFRFKNEQD